MLISVAHHARLIKGLLVFFLLVVFVHGFVMAFFSFLVYSEANNKKIKKTPKTKQTTPPAYAERLDGSHARRHTTMQAVNSTQHLFAITGRTPSAVWHKRCRTGGQVTAAVDYDVLSATLIKLMYRTEKSRLGRL